MRNLVNAAMALLGGAPFAAGAAALVGNDRLQGRMPGALGAGQAGAVADRIHRFSLATRGDADGAPNARTVLTTASGGAVRTSSLETAGANSLPKPAIWAAMVFGFAGLSSASGRHDARPKPRVRFA